MKENIKTYEENCARTFQYLQWENKNDMAFENILKVARYLAYKLVV